MAQAKHIPKKTVRSKRISERRWLFDFRGIRNCPPTEKQKKQLNRLKAVYAGEKPYFASPQQLQIEVDQYFESCYGPLIDRKKGQPVYDNEGNIIKVQVEPFTVSGLAYWIGVPTTMLDRITDGLLDDLSETDEDKLCSTILKRAKQKIAVYAEKRLYDREGVNGARFVLDTHFRMVTRKEQAEIAAMEKTMEYKRQELELKKQMLDVDDEDNSLSITIVRKED